MEINTSGGGGGVNVTQRLSHAKDSAQFFHAFHASAERGDPESRLGVAQDREEETVRLRVTVLDGEYARVMRFPVTVW
ncbi:hypothetical protein SRHO_G00085830 [Serrasalmus rhombeus]